MKLLPISFLSLLLLCGVSSAQGLRQLPYLHPGLSVDLGVGLWAWPIPCDADGDGDYDLIVSCPDKPSNGIWFFENVTGDTAQHKLPVFKPGVHLSRTVGNLMPSDVDGTLRMLSPGSEYLNLPKTGTAEKIPIPLKQPLYKHQWNEPKGPKIRHNQWRYVDYDGDGALDLIVGIEDWSEYGWDDAFDSAGNWTHGPLHGFVLLYRNTGSNDTPNYAPFVYLEADGKPVDTFGCPSPNFADFDGDGDLDLLCGEFLDGFTYFENIGTRTSPRYAAGRRLTLKDGTPLTMDLEMIVPIAFDWDKDGDFDLIVGDEDGRVAFIENITTANGKQAPQFAAPVYFQQEAETLKCGALATPVGVDWDGDGDLDIVSGNTAGYIEFFENLSGPNVASPKWAAPKRLEVNGKPFRVMAGPNGSIQGPAEAKWGYTTFSVADWDGDGLPDIVLNSILGRVVWLKNIGTRTDPRLAPAEAITVEWNGPTPKPAWFWWNPQGKELVTQWRTTPVVHDFTGDGLPDLAMLDVEGFFVLFERAKQDDQLILRAPRRAFTNEKGQPLRFNDRTAGGSGRRKIAVVDWDGDGHLDLLLNSKNADLYRGLGQKDGHWQFQRVGTLDDRNIEGHDVSPTTVDFDGNGIPDFLGGAEDGRFYLLVNPRAQ